jgi:hypothetical protein
MSVNDVLAVLPDGSPHTVAHACMNTAIIGKSGGGKTFGSGDWLLRCLVRYRNSGGLWLASKPEDVDYARRLFREEGRPKDLLIMEPGGQYRFNPLDYEMQKGAGTRELTQQLMTFGETLERCEEAGGGDRDPYWRGQARRRLHNGIEVCHATGSLIAKLRHVV